MKLSRVSISMPRNGVLCQSSTYSGSAAGSEPTVTTVSEIVCGTPMVGLFGGQGQQGAGTGLSSSSCCQSNVNGEGHCDMTKCSLSSFAGVFTQGPELGPGAGTLGGLTSPVLPADRAGQTLSSHHEGFASGYTVPILQIRKLRLRD